jgi:hypothetical protein
MNATIIHDENGQIIAISKIVDLKKAGSRFDKVGMIPGKGQHKLELELSNDLQNRPLSELHKEYRIDVATSTLVKKEND